MEKDAASAGVEKVGGLFNTTEIRILICYILASIREPVPANMLANVLHYEGIANGFEVSDAITSLAESGHITLSDTDNDAYTVTEVGRSAADTLKASLAFNVRERAYTAALKMMSRFKNLRNTDFSITHEDGKTYIICSVLDQKQPFMTIKLMVPDELQAECIKERFLSDPSSIYSGLIELLTK